MNVLVSGANGLIGSALLPVLSRQGFLTSTLTRSPVPQDGNAVSWDPDAGTFSRDALEGVDAVVHLAGESIVGRWTAARKARIRQSRIQGTQLLANTMARMQHPPKVFVCASAIGYYGDRGEEMLDESSASGNDFLSSVCQSWEAAALAAKERGIRTAHLRFGVVLSKKGGALQKMLTPFQLGMGGPMGSGKQYWSWIAVDDVVGAIEHALTNDKVSGPVNAVAPAPATNAVFTKILAQALRRPAFMPVPRFAARLLLGEMADALLFASTRVTPRRLKETDYRFRLPELDAALRYILAN